MSKFIKRVKKSLRGIDTALVLGDAFGNLPEVLTVFNSVFVYNDQHPDLRRKNLVYIQKGCSLDTLPNIDAVFINLSRVKEIESLVLIMTKFKPTIFIEGDEVIGRSLSVELYRNNYRASEQLGTFHSWKKL